MKQCPKCNDFALYDDTVTVCPNCDTPLVTYTRSRPRPSQATQATQAGEPVIEPDAPKRDSSLTRRRRDEPVFESTEGNRTVYRGIVVEMASSVRHSSNLMKWLGAVFAGIPFQIGTPAYETILRVENYDENHLSTVARNLVFYGNIEGQVAIGDDVSATVKYRRNQNIITSLYSNETESYVHARGQVAPGAAIALTLFMIALVVLVLYGLYSLVFGGGLWTILSLLVGVTMGIIGKLIVILAPLLLMVFIYWVMFHRK